MMSTQGSGRKRTKGKLKQDERNKEKQLSTEEMITVVNRQTTVNKVSDESAEVLARGGKAKTCTDQYGCHHNGICEMQKMTKPYFLKYMKAGGWLEDKSCRVCKQGFEQNSTPTKVGYDMVYCFYCDQGINAQKFNPLSLNPEEVWKHDQFKCDHVLCVECGNARIVEYEGNEGRGR